MPRRDPLPIDPIAEAKRQWIAHGWEDAAEGMTVVTSVMRAQQLLLARIEGTLKPFQLTFARFELLRLIAFTHDGRVPLTRAVKRLQVHPATVTSAVDRLVKDGLVERERHPDDGRAAVLTITDAGRELVDRATDALNGVFADIGMPQEDAVALVRIIARFRERQADFVIRPTLDPL
jgi:DNA-binding MarR family transcriptional regulator